MLAFAYLFISKEKRSVPGDLLMTSAVVSGGKYGGNRGFLLSALVAIYRKKGNLLWLTLQ